ncbi:virion core protein [Sporanaerobium hydrogeniformans]|uniref:Virion core protein n=1 Tax=Sporanaerobium hydrogeniformans TaxID=3072179 RepID=A0AC61DIK1_9FIRM|nr:SPFH domain-containing protein [Sporanaerobium hydrogeniformans]PHV71942.1 virion core protein [Sporanaerobium hydrogeniformans]
MGIIKAAAGAVGGLLGDQWLEAIEPMQMDNETLATYGVFVRGKDRRNTNHKGTEDLVTNGSLIHVPENVFMLLVDGGKIIAATDEAGYYQVDQSTAPSLFFKAAEGIQISGFNNTGNHSIQRPGGFVNTLKDSWERFKFGGSTPFKQQVIYINKQEIPNIRFGTKNPVPYTDRTLVPGRGVPCKITSFGSYSIRIGDPLLFYSEVCSKTGKKILQTQDMAEQYINEFLMAYQTALASLSTLNVAVSDIAIKTMELGTYMAQILDQEWLSKRGFYIESVGIAGLNYDEKTQELLDKYANDSILFDPNARIARMTAGMAAGLESAGSNEGGTMLGFAGMNMGMNTAGQMGVMPGQQMAYGQVIPTPTSVPTATSGRWSCTCGAQMEESAKFCSNCGIPRKQEDKEEGWMCECGKKVTEGKFCPNCGSKKIEKTLWKCSCGHETSDLFCSQCGKKKPQSYKCDKCGYEPENKTNPPKFCPKCGDPFDEKDQI